MTDGPFITRPWPNWQPMRNDVLSELGELQYEGTIQGLSAMGGAEGLVVARTAH
jgi:hypothetical protein